jgi:Tfp pilus assembly protein PilE
LDLAIFAICAVICLQVFTQAHIESSRSAAQSQLGIEAQRVAELFKMEGNDAEALASKLNADRSGNTLSWYYDHDLQAVGTADKAHYTLTCVIDDSRAVKVAKITLMEGSTLLLEYDVSSYAMRGGGS